MYSASYATRSTVVTVVFGILQQNEYNPLESFAWVNLGAKLKLGCISKNWVHGSVLGAFTSFLLRGFLIYVYLVQVSHSNHPPSIFLLIEDLLMQILEQLYGQLTYAVRWLHAAIIETQDCCFIRFLNPGGHYGAGAKGFYFLFLGG